MSLDRIGESPRSHEAIPIVGRKGVKVDVGG